MIGFLFILFIFIAWAIESHRKSSIEDYSKHNPINIHGERSYFDKNGVQRLLGSNRKVSYSVDPWTGDYVCTDLKTRETLRNFSEENRNKQNEDSLLKAIQNGEKYYLYRMQGDKNFFYEEKVRGWRYKNIIDGSLCVKRNVPSFICKGNGSDFYMDVETGKYKDAIYFSDEDELKNAKHDEEVKRKFNEWRSSVKDKGDFYNHMNW